MEKLCFTKRVFACKRYFKKCVFKV